VILSYKIRSLSKEAPFWSAFGLWFTFTPVLVRARSEDDSSRWERFDSGGDGEVFLFVARRRSESFSWIVPEDDVALLEGVGGRGTEERKGDDVADGVRRMKSTNVYNQSHNNSCDNHHSGRDSPAPGGPHWRHHLHCPYVLTNLSPPVMPVQSKQLTPLGYALAGALGGCFSNA